MNSGKPEIIRKCCYDTVHHLYRRSGYGLINEEVFVERLYTIACASDEILSLISDEKLLQKEMQRLAKQIYSENLYLVLRNAQGQERELAYGETWKFLFRIAYNLFLNQQFAEKLALDLAEECTQNALFNIYRNLKNVKSPSSFLGYAMTVLKHECVHLLSKMSKSAQKEISPEELSQERGLDSEFSIEDLFSFPTSAPTELVNILLECLLQALERLKNKDWISVLTLQHFSGLDDHQIGEIIGISYRNVQTMRHRALEALKKDKELHECIETN